MTENSAMGFFSSCVFVFCVIATLPGSEGQQSCSTLPVIRNAVLSNTCSTGQVNGSTCTAFCMNGYDWSDGSTSITVTCNNGTWSESPIECTAWSCSELSAPTSGSVSCPNGQFYNSVCTYSCNTGYDGSGTNARFCQSTRDWNGTDDFMCTAWLCPSLSHPTSGSVSCTNGLGYNSVCTYSCSTGYDASGTNPRICQSTRDWSGTDDFMCTAWLCPSLSHPTSGSVSCTNGLGYNSVCTYSCSTGYDASGTNPRICQSTRDWSGTDDFMCTVWLCPTLSHPTSGSVSCTNGFYYNSVCTYSCNTGYDGSGTTSRTCQLNKVWSGDEEFTCSECPENTYGDGCSSECTCVTNADCNHVDGSCTCSKEFDGMVCNKNQLAVSLILLNPYAPGIITNTTDLLLLCNVNLPSVDVTVKWTKNGEELLDSAVPVNGFLTLTRPSPVPVEDSGVYACVATTDNGPGGSFTNTSSSAVSVDVQVPATITESPVGVNLPLSHSPEFTCAGHGKPLPNVTWHRGSSEEEELSNGGRYDVTETDNVYSRSSVLRINSLVRSDNGEYFCRVKNGYNNLDVNFDVVVLEVPDPVRILSFVAKNAERIDLSWEVTYSGNLDIINCTVEYTYLEQSSAWSSWEHYETVEGSASMVQIEGLTPYTYHKARVRCRNDQGLSNATESHKERTKFTSPDPPTDVTLEAISESQLNVTWTAPGSVYGILNSYKVYYKKEGESDYGEEKQTSGTETYLIVDGLDAYTVYNVQVTSINTEENSTETNESSFSDMRSERTLEGVPSRANLVIFENISSTELKLEWKPPQYPRGVTVLYVLKLVDDDSRLKVQEHDFTNVETPEDVRTDYSFTFRNLIPFTSYNVIVIVCNSRNCSGEESQSATTGHGKPDPPILVQLCDGTEPDSPDCNVCWDEPRVKRGIITYYKLEYTVHKRNERGFDMNQDDNGHWVVAGDSDRYSESKDGLWPYSDYQIRVRAATYAEESDLSGDTVSCRTQPSEPPTITLPQMDKIPTSHKGFQMQLSEASNRNGPISCYEVIVVKLAVNSESGLEEYDSSTQDPDMIFPPGEVVDYATAKGNPGTAYVAIKMSGNNFQEFVQVGSNSRTSCKGDGSSRKRRQSVEDDTVYNGELQPDSSYQAFLRAYVENPDGGDPFYSSSPFIEAVETGSAPQTAAIAAISVVVVILVIVIIILTVILVRRFRRKSEEPRTGNGGMWMNSFNRSGKTNQSFSGEGNTITITYPAIPNERLPQVYADKHANENALFKEEYDNLPRSSRPITVEASSKPENKSKNRYINILAYDQSRVKLEIIDDDEDSDYINACYVDGYKSPNKFIAAQGPKDDTIEDFWRMIWEQKTLTIVMVTKCFENGREKCAQYWPDSGTDQYGYIEVTFEEVTALADYQIRTFSICHISDEEEKRKITQLHYTSWPDFGVPGSPIGMLNFIKRARAINPARAGPMVVHCSAGVGRTGTFIVLDAMMDQMAAEGKADVFGFVSQIRGQRNHLVQADVQYFFIHQALAEHYLYGNTEIDVGNLLIHWHKLNRKQPNSDKTGLEVEYEKLIDTAIENVVITEAHHEANRGKNRVVNIVPYDGNRFKLIRLIGKEYSDYVNASLIDGYRQKGAYIAAQGPLPNTLEDFWRLIWECRTGSIVMLTNLMERNQVKCEQYWPEEVESEEPEMFGTLAVIKKKEEDYTAYTIQEFFVTDTKGGETRTIRHFHYTDWPEIGAPERGTGMIEMMGQIQKQQQQTGNKPILVHCSTGAGRTGVFCALSTVIERIKAEAIVDIFQTYKVLRQQRPNIIQSIDQYHFVYKAVLDYLDSFDSYDNFK